MNSIPSKKVIGADNQQERLKIENWIVGFTDGEGCFSVSIIKNKTTSLGWQVFPEFVVTQGEKSKKVLESIRKYFDCGKIFVNKRYDNHNENIYRYCVRPIDDLNKKIIPFFTKNKLRTEKYSDFVIFSKIILMIKEGRHLSLSGIKKIAKMIEKMNRKKPSKFLESSETIRQTKLSKK
ncbi:MAG: LAGLIDADG family homing endonuclease [Patescibacteria group bacterium]